MPKLLKSDAVRKAYVEPIRTVLLIDDEFPTYTSAVGKDVARARSLWSACRKKGMLCDVDDGSGVTATEVPQHILKSDLVILDYHLNGTDPSASLAILARLSASDHASIAIVYTQDKALLDVRRRVSSHLRGHRVITLTPAEQAAVDALGDDWDPGFTAAHIDSFLSGDHVVWKSDNALRDSVITKGIERSFVTQILESELENTLATKFVAPAKAESETVRVGGGEAGLPLWAHTNNLLVVFITKSENTDEGDHVFASLDAALIDWNPGYLPTVLAYTRGVVARQGFRQEAAMLTDALLQAGWLYHAVGGDEQEQTDRITGLFARLLSRFTDDLLADVRTFGEATFPDRIVDQAPLAWAMQAAGVDDGIDDWQVTHRLNVFLATEPPGQYVQTGTIFRPGDADTTEVCVCVTPACDLVPREPRKGTWEHGLHPIRPVLAIRAQLLSGAAKHLASAEHGRDIYLTVDGKPKVVRLTDATSPNPRLEVFLLEDAGQISDAVVRVHRLSQKDGTLETSHGEMTVVGQLRGMYASRLLQMAGQHLSRIGVDFVNHPASPKVAPAV